LRKAASSAILISLPLVAMSQVVRYLVNRGANLEALDKYSQTPLHWAAWNGHAGVLKFLLERGADANCVDTKSCTPLWDAAYIGQSASGRCHLTTAADRPSPQPVRSLCRS
jgi:ankyrin repeat protein